MDTYAERPLPTRWLVQFGEHRNGRYTPLYGVHSFYRACELYNSITLNESVVKKRLVRLHPNRSQVTILQQIGATP